MQKTLFPRVRPRRLRLNETIRDLVSETNINKSKLIQPLFVSDTLKQKEEIVTMPGQYLYSKDDILSEIDELADLGINTIALFPNIESDLKDISGSEALKEDNFICSIVRQIKERFPKLVIITDVALDPYTSSGHDGIISDGKIDNDLTLEALSKMSINLASSGADILAPSDMMDGRIGKIRDSLEKNNHKDTILLSYAAKYASNFYGPFRDAVGSKQIEGISKKTYQMDSKNLKEAYKEILLDINEGADIVMVKPAMPYLDVINDLSQKTNVPIFAYQVSGEYSMLKMGIDKKIFDHNVIPETLISLFRAGSSSVITYFARWTAENYDNIS
jgi:porphobilinogen synthase